MNANVKGRYLLELNILTGKILSVFGITGACEPTLYENKYKSCTSNENLLSKLRCPVSIGHTPDFKYFV